MSIFMKVNIYYTWFQSNAVENNYGSLDILCSASYFSPNLYSLTQRQCLIPIYSVHVLFIYF